MSTNLIGVLSQDNIDKLNKIPATETKKRVQNLDKDAFLKLMLTQLQYQNPLSPMDNKEFIAQMAQFSSVEQMANISKNAEAENKLSQEIKSELANMTTLLKVIANQNGGISGNPSLGLDEKILKELEKITNLLNLHLSKTNIAESTSDKKNYDLALEEVLSNNEGN